MRLSILLGLVCAASLTLSMALPACAQEVPHGCAAVERQSGETGPVIGFGTIPYPGEEELEQPQP